MRKVLIIPFILFLLCSCGFHLRGMVDAPTWLQCVAIISDNNTKELNELLEAQFKAYHIKVSADPAKAPYWLMINQSTLGKQIISIGASTNSRQYQLTLTTEFSLQKSNGEPVQSPRRIQVSRQFTLNNDRILGSNQEESLFVDEMRHETAVQILNRLNKNHAN